MVCLMRAILATRWKPPFRKMRRNSVVRENTASEMSLDLSLRVTVYREPTPSVMFNTRSESKDDALITSSTISKTQIRDLADRLKCGESELTTLLEDFGLIRPQSSLDASSFKERSVPKLVSHIESIDEDDDESAQSNKSSEKS